MSTSQCIGTLITAPHYGMEPVQNGRTALVYVVKIDGLDCETRPYLFLRVLISSFLELLYTSHCIRAYTESESLLVLSNCSLSTTCPQKPLVTTTSREMRDRMCKSEKNWTVRYVRGDRSFWYELLSSVPFPWKSADFV